MLDGGSNGEAETQTWFAIVAIEYAAFRGAMVRLASDASIPDSTDTAIAW
jgi:hypothetical protein